MEEAMKLHCRSKRVDNIKTNKDILGLDENGWYDDELTRLKRHIDSQRNYLKSVEKHKDRLEIFYLPAYCPNMNPQELVNQDVKANANNFRALKSLKDLTINLRICLIISLHFRPLTLAGIGKFLPPLRLMLFLRISK